MNTNITNVSNENFKKYLQTLLPWLIILLMALNMFYQHIQFENFKETLVEKTKIATTRELDNQVLSLKNEIADLRNTLNKYEEDYEHMVAEERNKLNEDMRITENYQHVLNRDDYSLTKENIRTLEKYAQDDDMPDVNPHLVFAMIYLESQFNPDAISKDKYIGLGQISLDTAKYVKSYFGYDDVLSKETLKDTNLNIKYQVSYMRLLYKTQGRNWYNVIMIYSGAKVADNPNEYMWKYIGHLNSYLSRTKGTSFQKIIADKDFKILLE